MNTYIKRSIRYFVYLAIVFGIIATIMALTGNTEFTSISGFLESSSFLILISTMVLFSALYPKMGYTNRVVAKIANIERLEGDFKRIGICKEKELGNVSYYRYESTAKRIMTRFDDTFTIQYNENGAIIDGTKVMVARVWMLLDQAQK